MNRDRSMLLVGVVALAAMWRLDGARSAAALGVLVGGLLLLHSFADSLGEYTGWAGRRAITSPTPAGIIRGFASIGLVTVTVLLLLRLFF